ncbi:TPA_asm: hypothetical protein G4P47_004519 [Salmonella enterica subsp. enterica serovar Javiana]|uniref:Uncharacterized protein n=1 Tax=Salmonella enterica subsp. enterica serovar Javiana TaxID=363569 RepID=A0A736PFK1_SALET|nr:hypothetical protein [Salmonella enterica subsp. enterica serovar 9,12:-:1,5]EKR2051099.1 hypothetical protein [Salmonella enterica subsp. enterica serovar Javiana]HAE7705470.1 hypothetical protein [Salmonella enterica subsp. enterica serovar Javiana]
MANSEKDLPEAGFSKPKVGNVHIDAQHPEFHWVNNTISCHKKRDSRSVGLLSRNPERQTVPVPQYAVKGVTPSASSP